jgi:hypothetical protein
MEILQSFQAERIPEAAESAEQDAQCGYPQAAPEHVRGDRHWRRMESLDAEVLATLEDDIMRPSVVEEAIRLALAELARARQSAARRRLETELAAVRLECERLAEAIAHGGPLDVLMERLRARQTRRVALEGELAAQRQVASYASPHALEARLRAKLADWRGLLRRNVTEGRAVLRQLLIGPLLFSPVNEERRRGYAFEGLIALDRLIAGVLELPTKVASPGGSANRWTVTIRNEWTRVA